METRTEISVGDCLEVLQQVEPESVDLVYIDPPFFTQRIHSLSTRCGDKEFSFSDVWDSEKSYIDFLFQRVSLARKVLKDTGSLFFHCDKSASHTVRMMLDSIFSPENFQSEIIWHFRRWSNSKKGLLPAHQNVFFYSKTSDFKFNPSYRDYSVSTNVDQTMQKRVKDDRNKSVYARDEKNGSVISNGSKKGVPLSDVWEIPFLNPKAKERVGYPTQKPVLLLNQIINLVTDEGDTVLDPFCGSGTTLVASKILNRHSIGIDISDEAIELTKTRLANPIMTDSKLFRYGEDAYKKHSIDASIHLAGIDYTPVHRNLGIDGVLKEELNGLPIFIRVQRDNECLSETVTSLIKASKNKGNCKLVVVETSPNSLNIEFPKNVSIIASTVLSLRKLYIDDNQIQNSLEQVT